MRKEITVEVHPSLIYCAYRSPAGFLFKRKYIGYRKAAAVTRFRREIRKLKNENCLVQ